MALLARAVTASIALLLGLPSHARAQEMEVPVAVQIPLFLKVMSFDRQLRTRAAGTLVIAIVYQNGYRTSAAVKEEAWRAASRVREIDRMAVRVVAIDLDRSDLAEELARSRATLVYLAPVRGVDVSDLALVTRTFQVTTLTGVLRYLDQGMAVGVRLRGDRPRIVVNLAASRSEGAELAAELLKLAEVQ